MRVEIATAMESGSRLIPILIDGAGMPPPGLPVQVLCEDQSGTYQLPFACHYANGQWRNHESGGALEAMVVGWRVPRF